MTKIWDSGSGRLLQTWLSATDGSVRLAFSPDGKLLATASDWGITIRDVKSEEQTAKYRYPDAEIKTLSFRPTGDHLAFGGSFGIIVISVKSGAAIYSERNRDVQALAYAPDGRLVVADESGTLEILDSAYRKTISQTASKGVRSIAFSRNGKELVLAYDRAVALWRLGRETLSLVLESWQSSDIRGIAWVLSDKDRTGSGQIQVLRSRLVGQDSGRGRQSTSRFNANWPFVPCALGGSQSFPPASDYYYLTEDSTTARLQDPAVRNAALSSQELQDQLHKIRALKQILILDTCAAGRVAPVATIFWVGLKAVLTLRRTCPF
jgi:WD40 repeat protein